MRAGAHGGDTLAALALGERPSGRPLADGEWGAVLARAPDLTLLLPRGARAPPAALPVPLLVGLVWCVTEPVATARFDPPPPRLEQDAGRAPPGSPSQPACVAEPGGA